MIIITNNRITIIILDYYHCLLGIYPWLADVLISSGAAELAIIGRPDKTNKNIKTNEKKKKMFPLRIELRTFRVLSGCDNHYTTETVVYLGHILIYINIYIETGFYVY